jgi:hypothetical protein
MKKGNTLYLRPIVVIFVLLWIPYFENIIVVNASEIMFFGRWFSFIKIYPWLLFLWVLEWALIVFYVQSVIEDIKKQDLQKFDL